MGQCCGFVKSDKSSTLNTGGPTKNQEETFLEIEKAIKNMDDGKKKADLLRDLNQRSSMIFSKESYQDMIEGIQHKIYEGPGKNNGSKNEKDSSNQKTPKDDSSLNNSKEKNLVQGNNNNSSTGVINLDDTKDDLKIKSQLSKEEIAVLEGSSIKQPPSAQNGIKQSDINLKLESNSNINPENNNNSNSKTKIESQQQLSQNEQSKQQQSSSKDKNQQKQQLQQQQKKSDQNNNGKAGENNNNNLKNQQRKSQQEKSVGFALEDIEREMKKADKYRNGEGAQTEYDNQSTTKTEKQVKSVLKKYSDVKSCYTAEGGEGAKKSPSKKKKVKFKDPQKPKKKVVKRSHH